MINAKTSPQNLAITNSNHGLHFLGAGGGENFTKNFKEKKCD